MGIYKASGALARRAYDKDGTYAEQLYSADGTPLLYESFRAIAIVASLPQYSVSGIKQGACTDGEYIYQIVFDSNAYKTGTFVKYRIADGTVETKTFDDTIPYSHGNDMCYNPVNGHIYVAAMTDDGAVMELDTSFNYITTHYLLGEDGQPYAVWGLCFDQLTNCFMSEHGHRMVVYDKDLAYKRDFPMPDFPSATGQGCETDGKFIYRVWYRPNMIDIATVAGAYVCQVSLPINDEPETMMYNWVTDKYYINVNGNGQLFYDVDLQY